VRAVEKFSNQEGLDLRALRNVELSLYKSLDEDAEEANTVEINTIRTDQNGYARFDYLERGEYYIMQKAVPIHYSLNASQKYKFAIGDYRLLNGSNQQTLADIEIDYLPHLQLNTKIKNLSHPQKNQANPTQTVTKKGDFIEVELTLSYLVIKNSGYAHNVRVDDFSVRETLEDVEYIDPLKCEKFFSIHETIRPGQKFSCRYRAQVKTDYVQIFKAEAVEGNHSEKTHLNAYSYAFTYPHEAHGKVTTDSGQKPPKSQFILRDAMTNEPVFLSNQTAEMSSPFSEQANEEGLIVTDESGEIDLYYLPEGSFYLDQIKSEPGFTFNTTDGFSFQMTELADITGLNVDLGQYMQTQTSPPSSFTGQTISRSAEELERGSKDGLVAQFEELFSHIREVRSHQLSSKSAWGSLGLELKTALKHQKRTMLRSLLLMNPAWAKGLG
jgi:hypothetical protein